MELPLSYKKQFLKHYMLTGEITKLSDKITLLYAFPENAKKPPQTLITTN